MKIKELSTSSKRVTIEFDYEELRCIKNALYQISRFDDIEKDSNFKNVRADVIGLFQLMKFGKITEFGLQNMYKLLLKEGAE